jgi:hypothetical protein
VTPSPNFHLYNRRSVLLTLSLAPQPRLCNNNKCRKIAAAAAASTAAAAAAAEVAVVVVELPKEHESCCTMRF